MLLASAFPAVAQTARALKFDEVKRLVKIASPYGSQVLAHDLRSGGSYQTRNGLATVSGMDPAVYLRGRTTDAMLGGVDVMIHESTHHLCKMLAYERDPDSIHQRGTMMAMPDTRVRIFVRGTETFPSKETVGFFRGQFARAPRFDTYIDSEMSQLATQSCGVYGLLDEYNAYYAGIRTANDVFKYYLRLPVKKGTEGLWMMRLSEMSTGIGSFPEFRGYIGGYLAFAKQNHPSVYKEVTGNAGFVKAFRALTKSFRALTHELVSQFDSRLALFNRKGLDIQMVDGTLKVKSAGRGLGFGYYHKLEKALAGDSRIQAELKKLKA